MATQYIPDTDFDIEVSDMNVRNEDSWNLHTNKGGQFHWAEMVDGTNDENHFSMNK